MSAYCKFGSTIKGESLAEGHKGTDGWFEVNSVQWGCGRGISTPVGGSSKREASAPSISEVTITKRMDSVSPKLVLEALAGTGEDVTIELVETAGKTLETFLTVTMTNTMVSGYSMSSAGDRPSESFTFNFTKIKLEYKGYDDKHKIDSNKAGKVEYDLAAAKEMT
ncbi:MAG: type VI secretion system tube protein Hcp [Planctomycetes bacterium]|nr:type VI secretion system tube protein Hcp [Planctomycetota bacterium]